MSGPHVGFRRPAMRRFASRDGNGAGKRAMIRDVRICFVGDSFVNGVGDEAALGWAGRLCAAAAIRGVTVTCYNLGVRRDTTRDILLRWERECALRLPVSCDGRMVLSAGVNDAAIENGRVRVDIEESSANFRDILCRARRYAALIVGPPPVSDDGWNERIKALTAVMVREADAQGVSYIDLFTPLAADEAYRNEILKRDGAHPGSAGYTKMAQIVDSSPHWWFQAG